MVVGFLLALFTLVQASSAFAQSGKNPATPPSVAFEILAFVTLAGVLYSMFRLVFYAFAASLLLNAPMDKYSEFKSARKSFGLSDFGMVGSYVGMQLANTKTWRSRFFANLKNYGGKYEKGRPKYEARFAIQPTQGVALVLAFLLTPIVFGLSPDLRWTVDLIEGIVLLDLWRTRFDKGIRHRKAPEKQ